MKAVSPLCEHAGHTCPREVVGAFAPYCDRHVRTVTVRPDPYLGVDRRVLRPEVTPET